MGAWQPLPGELPAEVRHFVEQVRLLKDSTGLSLVALGARTAYSKSSWQRYLNGTQPPPRQAVAALCRVAGLTGADAERFGVRWELAVRVWPRAPAPLRLPVCGPVPSGRDGAQDGRGEHDEHDGRGEHDGRDGRDGRDGHGGHGGVGQGADDPAGACGYEEEPTLPWWDLLDEEPPPGPRTGRLLLYAALLVLVLLLVAVAGAVAPG
ncbi:helix-turn-helix transcriptional regulator [Streptomyces sp. NPDC002769]|uniref:helix-turn-helix domain-containing protein n=1 Tax=Streptomyces sp. NPDC002769 TaxID=3154542 RepID=UPI00331F07C0